MKKHLLLVAVILAVYILLTGCTRDQDLPVLKIGKKEIEIDRGKKITLISVDETWEPGICQDVTVTFENIGEGIMGYAFFIDDFEHNARADLSEVLDVYVGTSQTELTAENYIGTLAQMIKAERFDLDNGLLYPKEEVTFNLIIKMREEAGNEYQSGSGYSPPACSFDIKILATPDGKKPSVSTTVPSSSQLPTSLSSTESDSVETETSSIQAGVLDIELIDGTPLFFRNIEPGDTQTSYQTIQNTGTLPAKYAFSFTDVNHSGAADVAEVLDIYAGVDRDNQARLGTLAELIEMGSFAIPDASALQPGEQQTVWFSIAMNLSAGNEYQGSTIDFDVTVTATQID